MFLAHFFSWQSHSGAVNFTSTPKVVSAYADGSSNTIRPTSLTYPNGREIASDYGTSGGMEDCVSRVASLIDDDSTILADYEYLGLGAVVSDICLETGVSYTLIDPTGGTDPDTGDIYGGLDRFSRIKDVRWRKSGSDVSRVQYGYDRASNRTWRRNPSDSGNHYDWLYSYDGLHRLKHADRGTLDGGHTSIGSPQFAQCWTLDETGNWSGFRQSDSGSSWSLVQSRTSNAANEISSIANSTGGPWTSPSYDAAGNMLNIPQPASPVSGYWATYDAWNRLVTLKSGSQTVQENEYDARNYRTVRKSYTSGSLTETRHAYYSDGWQVLEERLGSSTTPDRHFVWGLRYIDDLILRDRTTSGTLDERLYALQDANWNVTAVVDYSGTVQERYEYDPYGMTTVLTPSFGSRGTSSFEWETTYAGYRWDAGTGLFAVRNRYFHPRLGAWVSRDPIGLWNYPPSLYEYVWSSPVSHSDRLGLAGEALPGGSWNPVNWPGQITYPVFKFVGDVWYDNYGDEHRIRGKQADLDMRAQATDGGRSCDELRGKIRDQNQRPIPKTWNSTIQQAEVAVAGSYGNYPGFVGCRRAPLSNSPLQPIRNNPAVINGRRYTGHALDQMSNRGIPPSVVEDTLRSGKFMGQSGDKYVWETSNAKVITNINGDVVTVVPR